jgi:hypothetical protein
VSYHCECVLLIAAGYASVHGHLWRVRSVSVITSSLVPWCATSSLTPVLDPFLSLVALSREGRPVKGRTSKVSFDPLASDQSAYIRQVGSPALAQASCHPPSPIPQVIMPSSHQGPNSKSHLKTLAQGALTNFWAAWDWKRKTISIVTRRQKAARTQWPKPCTLLKPYATRRTLSP